MSWRDDTATTIGMTMRPIGEWRKAVVAALLAGLTAAGVAAADGTVTLVEWIAIAAAMVATQQGVYWTSNDPPTEEDAPSPDQLT